MTIEWTIDALDDRGAIMTYLELESPLAALNTDERIEAQIERLRNFPDSGRPGRVDGTPELIISGTPYIAVYSTAAAGVRILRVLHGARMWPGDSSGS